MRMLLTCVLTMLVSLSPVKAANANTLTTKLSAADVLNITKHYNKLWPNLTSNDEKIAFAHLFLKQLNHKTQVISVNNSENELTVVIPGNKSTGGQIQLLHNLSVTAEDYLVVEQGLRTLAMTNDDSQINATWPKLKKRVKWVIEGKGTNRDSDINTMLPDDVMSTCYSFGSCTYEIAEIIDNGGFSTGVGVGYDWMWYRDFSFSFTPEDGKRWEDEQCSVHDDCAATIYYDYEYGSGEKCVMVVYDEVTIMGLYCEVNP